jgi:hypothetical protein
MICRFSSGHIDGLGRTLETVLDWLVLNDNFQALSFYRSPRGPHFLKAAEGLAVFLRALRSETLLSSFNFFSASNFSSSRSTSSSVTEHLAEFVDLFDFLVAKIFELRQSDFLDGF